MERHQEIIQNQFEQLQRLGAENTALQAENERLKARAEALKQIIHGNCRYCVFHSLYQKDEPCRDCHYLHKNLPDDFWQFAEARFAGGERE